MQYRKNPKNGDELSILGFGCMRFPKDAKETERLILYAIDHGVNYFDTAYMYRGSEAALGEALHRHDKRGEVFIATKIVPMMIRKTGDFEKYFRQQLDRLQTDYIDYYMMHMLTDAKTWRRMLDLGIEAWIAEKKAEGKIRNLGFSYHGGREEFFALCDAWQWDFCLIQYNYLDEFNQAGKDGLRYAAGKGMPVMVMEPLRGGLLASSLPKGVKAAFERAPVDRSPAEWSFRWLWDQPEVTCVLSGMEGMEVLRANIEVASSAEAGAFTESDFAVIAQAKAAFSEAIKVPCTGCGYCMPCPQGVDIPTCLSCYNNIVIEGKGSAIRRYLMQTSMKAKPQAASLCSKCGACEPRCPQGIAIRDALAHTATALEPFYFKPAVAVARWIQKL